MRNAWDLHAGEWISWARAPGHDSYWRFHREAFLPLVPPPERLTLDIGCGEGRLTRDLSRLGHRVLGIDASPAMVTAAASVPGAAGRVAAGDAAALPVADAAADCAVAFMSLQDIDHMEQAVAEAARVLVPGGRLVIAVTHPANTAGKFAPGARKTHPQPCSHGNARPRIVAPYRAARALNRLLVGNLVYAAPVWCRAELIDLSA